MNRGEDPLEDLYDVETLEAIEAWARERVVDTPAEDELRELEPSADQGDSTEAEYPSSGPAHPGSMAAAIWASALLGAGEALEPERVRPDVAEYVPATPEGDQPVTFLFVPGDPQASRIIVRPWLFG